MIYIHSIKYKQTQIMFNLFVRFIYIIILLFITFNLFICVLIETHINFDVLKNEFFKKI